jgi:hypothetical protein
MNAKRWQRLTTGPMMTLAPPRSWVLSSSVRMTSILPLQKVCFTDTVIGFAKLKFAAFKVQITLGASTTHRLRIAPLA